MPATAAQRVGPSTRQQAARLAKLLLPPLPTPANDNFPKPANDNAPRPKAPPRMPAGRRLPRLPVWPLLFVPEILARLPQGNQQQVENRGWTYVGPCVGARGPRTGWFSFFKTGANCLVAQASHGANYGMLGTVFVDTNTKAHQFGVGYLSGAATRWDTTDTWHHASSGTTKLPWTTTLPDYQSPPLEETLPTYNRPGKTYAPDPNILKEWQRWPEWTRPDPTYRDDPEPDAHPRPHPRSVPVEVPGHGIVPTQTVTWTPPASSPHLPPTAQPGQGGAVGPGSGPSPNEGPTQQPTVPEPVVSAPPRQPEPPPPNTSETKIRNVKKALGMLDTVSELSEIVDAMFDALPPLTKYRWKQRARRLYGNRGLLDNAGQYGIDGADWKLQAIWRNWDALDASDAWKNIARNVLNDLLHGKVHQGLDRAPGASRATGGLPPIDIAKSIGF